MTAAILHASVVVVAMTLLILPAMLAILGRQDPIGACVGILGAAVLTSAAAVVATATNTPALPWYAVAVAASYAIAVVARVRDRTPIRTWREGGDHWAFAGAAMMALPAAAIAMRAPIIGDARWIWFFHASWFGDPGFVPGDITPAYTFAHPGYPPFGASFGGLGLLVGDARNDWIPQLATALLACCAVIIISIVASRPFSGARWRLGAAAVSAMAVFGIIAPRSLDGYMDGLVASLVALAVLIALSDDDAQVATVVIAAAAVTKNEGFMYVVVILVPLYWITRRSIRPTLLGLTMGAGWAVAIRLYSEAEPWVFSNIVPWSGAYSERFGIIVQAIGASDSLRWGMGMWLGAALGVAALGRWHSAQAVLAGTAATAIAATGLIICLYLTSPFDIAADGLDLAWHVRSSLPRVILTPAAILAVGGLAAGASTFSVLIGRQKPYRTTTSTHRDGA